MERSDYEAKTDVFINQVADLINNSGLPSGYLVVALTELISELTYSALEQTFPEDNIEEVIIQ